MERLARDSPPAFRRQAVCHIHRISNINPSIVWGQFTKAPPGVVNQVGAEQIRSPTDTTDFWEMSMNALAKKTLICPLAAAAVTASMVAAANAGESVQTPFRPIYRPRCELVVVGQVWV